MIPPQFLVAPPWLESYGNHRGPSGNHGCTMGEPWKKIGEPLGNHRGTIGEPWGNHRGTIGDP